MSLLSPAPRTTRLTLASAGAGPFNVGFRLFIGEGMIVYVDGIRRYDWSHAATFFGPHSDDARVTFNAALPSGSVITIDPTLPAGRTLNYFSTDQNLTANLNSELVRLWAALADVKRDAERAFRLLGNRIEPVAAPTEESVFGYDPITGVSLIPVDEFQGAPGAPAVVDYDVVHDVTPYEWFGLAPDAPFGQSWTSAMRHEVVKDSIHYRAYAVQALVNETAEGLNGPGRAGYGQFISSVKSDWLTTDLGGEIDGQSIVVRQGHKDDVGGILINAGKVRSGVGDTGGITGIECASFLVNPDGSTIRHVQTIMGFMEGLGGFTTGRGYGFCAEPRVGDVHSGFAAVGRSDLGTEFIWSYSAGSSRDPASLNFGVRGNDGTVQIGGGANAVTLRPIIGNLNVHNSDGNRMARVTGSGAVEAVLGLRPSEASSLLTRVNHAAPTLDFPSTPAHSNSALDVAVGGAALGDLVIVNTTSSAANGNLVFSGHVPSAGVVRVRCHNTSAAAIDPISQALAIAVLRLTA